jgi:hypothetical protein
VAFFIVKPANLPPAETVSKGAATNGVIEENLSAIIASTFRRRRSFASLYIFTAIASSPVT